LDWSSAEWQQKIREQYDSFCKTLLKNEMIDYKREMKYREDHEVSIFTISEEDIEQINATDHGIEVTERFRVMGFDIEVKNELLCEALKSLPKLKRDVILMSYFLDMTDTEIAKHMEVVRLTIRYHKLVSLQMLKKFMGEMDNETKR